MHKAIPWIITQSWRPLYAFVSMSAEWEFSRYQSWTWEGMMQVSVSRDPHQAWWRRINASFIQEREDLRIQKQNTRTQIPTLLPALA